MYKKYIFSNNDKQEIINLHNMGLYNYEIAERYNVSKSTIARILQSSDVESRHPLLTPEREKQAILLYDKLKSLNKVSKELHMSERTVAYILNKYNMHINTMSEVKQIYTVDESYFDIIDTNNKAYILGLLWSDGTINKKTSTVAISLKESDRCVLDKINNEIKSNRPLGYIDLKSKNDNYSNQYCLTINNKHIHDTLLNYNIVSNKSLYGVFPIGIPENLYSKFFLGIMDGDGNICKNPKDSRCSFISTERFCIESKNIIENILDIHCSIMLCHHNIDKPTRVLQIAGRNQVKKYLDWLYDDAEIYIPRKYDIYEKIYLQ